MPAVEGQGIRKQYGALVALEDFTISVEAGELLGVLGPNGAGKTTAIRILTTILGQDDGAFAVAGIPHTRPEEIRRRIGVLPESAGFPERQTGLEYLRYHARLFGQSRESARARSAALLADVGLDGRGGSLIATYSRGMRQRLGIARSLVNEPSVVFLDEPTLGLDPGGQREILANIRGIAAERGAAVLLCSHLLSEVEDNCTRVLILNRGRVVAQGTVAEIVHAAAAARSARLHVASEHVERAVAALASSEAIEEVERSDGQPGRLSVAFAPDGNGSGDGSLNEIVRVLLEAGVELRSFELERARLSDAFLAMTEGGVR